MTRVQGRSAACESVVDSRKFVLMIRNSLRFLSLACCRYDLGCSLILENAKNSKNFSLFKYAHNTLFFFVVVSVLCGIWENVWWSCKTLRVNWTNMKIMSLMWISGIANSVWKKETGIRRCCCHTTHISLWLRYVKPFFLNFFLFLWDVTTKRKHTHTSQMHISEDASNNTHNVVYLLCREKESFIL